MYKNSDIIGTQKLKDKEYLLENNNLDKCKVDFIYNWVQDPKKVDEKDYINYRKPYNEKAKIAFLY